MFWIYDIETYQNFFSVIFKNYTTKEVKKFVIFDDRNDLDELMLFINDQKKWLVGYNSFSFDNQILKYLYDNWFECSTYMPNLLTELIYNFSHDIIENDNRNYSYSLPFKYLDLMKIGNLGQKSLKLVGTVFKWHKLQDLPIANDQKIKPEDVDNILKYNLNDVEITERLFELLKEQIKLRFEVSDKYNIYAYSESDSGIANRLLEKFYSEETGLHKKDFKDLRTKRNKISFADVIMPDVEFQTEELEEFLDDIRSSVYFSSIPFMKKTFIFDGVKYIMGIGGLHSSDPGDLFESTEDLKIIDADVGSYYPTMIINNNIHPEHLGGSFIKKYKEIRDSRLEAKKKGDKTTSEAFKIILNSSYGKMKSDKHWLYDPLCALQVTINCQLYLIMLIEKLVLNGFKVISANTDGIVTMVPTKDEDKYKELCKEWEEYTNFSLEYSIYKKYARRDVNNYIAIKDNGDVKTKGDFTIPDINKLYQDPLMLRRGFNKPIISIALNEYFINDTPIEETIKNHKDIYNFCTSQKTDKSFRNEYHFVENREAKINNLQQSVRYYVSKDGGSLYKRHKEDGRLINYCVGKNVTLFNDYFDSENYNIDYNYYINQTQKIIDEIINPQLTLF